MQPPSLQSQHYSKDTDSSGIMLLMVSQTCVEESHMSRAAAVHPLTSMVMRLNSSTTNILSNKSRSSGLSAVALACSEIHRDTGKGRVYMQASCRHTR